MISKLLEYFPCDVRHVTRDRDQLSLLADMSERSAQARKRASPRRIIRQAQQGGHEALVGTRISHEEGRKARLLSLSGKVLEDRRRASWDNEPSLCGAHAPRFSAHENGESSFRSHRRENLFELARWPRSAKFRPMNDAAAQGAQIGVVGDVHLFWDNQDVAFFNRCNYDLLLFVGDLAGYTQVRGLQVARSLCNLRIPSMCIPGNHDGLHAFQLGAEIVPGAHRLRHAFGFGQDWRCRIIDKALGNVQLVGYSRHRMELSGMALNVIVGRPHSIGGRRIACARYLRSKHGIDSMDASSERLRSLVDQCDDAPILFLAHNGPSGLGDRAESIWGCDFRKKEEDWGDRDLEDAVQHAKSGGRTVLATVAGHMHRKTKSGKQRPGQVRKDGTLYVNAAEVPRHRIRSGTLRRHHVRLALTPSEAQAEDVWV